MLVAANKHHLCPAVNLRHFRSETWDYDRVGTMTVAIS